MPIQSIAGALAPQLKHFKWTVCVGNIGNRQLVDTKFMAHRFCAGPPELERFWLLPELLKSVHYLEFEE